MRNMHPITLLAFILFGAVAIAQVSYIASGPHGVTPTPHVARVEALPEPGPERRDEVQVAVATPNHDPQHVGAKPHLSETVAPEKMATETAAPEKVATETAATEKVATETAGTPQPDLLSLATKPQPA